MTPAERETPEVEFALVAEAGVLERQALLLCESLRRFAGRHADAPVTVVSPRADRRPSAAILERLAALGADYLELDVVSPVPEYGTSFRIHAAAEVERRSSARKILFMDSDLLFAGEPELDLAGCAAAARPVDVQGMCTTGPQDPRDEYWRNLCAVCGVSYDALPHVDTTVGNVRVKASYNGGYVLVDRDAGIFGRTLDYFLRSIDADLAPHRGSGIRVLAGHGLVSERGSELWGSSQACLSLAIWGSGLAVRIFDLSQNFPLNQFNHLGEAQRTTPLKVIHYHHLLDGDDAANPLLNGQANVPQAFASWLRRTRAAGSTAVPVGGGAGDERPLRTKRLVVVLGMHRSGTSAITRGLQVLGVDLGENLYGPHEGVNDKGFWEDIDVHSLNERMLAALQSSWSDVRLLDAGDIRALRDAGYFDQAVDLLTGKLADRPLFGFKDPRLGRLLPFWREVFDHCGMDVGYVIAVRHPRSVVRSLAARDGFEAEHAYLLWLAHMLTSLTASAGRRRVVVDYDALLEAPDWELDRVAAALGLVVEPDALTRYREDFLDTELRHTVFTSADLAGDPACPALVGEMHRALTALATDGRSFSDPGAAEDMRRWEAEIARMRPALALIDTLRAVAARTIADRDATITSLHRHVAERDRSIASLHAHVADRDGKIANLHRHVAERDRSIADLGARVADYEAEIARLHGDVAERERLIAKLQAEVKALRDSLSWRLTAFLRVLGGAVGRLRR